MVEIKFKFLTVLLKLVVNLTQAISFNPEILFPKESTVGRNIIKAYRECPPEIKDSGHYIPAVNYTKLLSNVKLPYQWETTRFTEVTSDVSRLLKLELQTPILIDYVSRRSLLKSLKKSGFDGKVRGNYTVDLDRAIRDDFNNPSRSFSFSSSENPSVHLEYQGLDIEDKYLRGIKVDVKVQEEWDKTQIGKNEFKFLDAVYEFSIPRKRELYLSFSDKLRDARGCGETGQLTMFIEKMAHAEIIEKYVPKEFRNDRMEKAKSDVQSLLESFEKGDYKAKLSKEAKQPGLSEMAQKILKLSEEEKICSKEKEGLRGAIQRLCFEKEIQDIIL
jgi:hypothetical protein